MLKGEPGWGWGAADKIVLEKHLQNSSRGRGESNNCKAKRMRQRRNRNKITKDESELLPKYTAQEDTHGQEEWRGSEREVEEGERKRAWQAEPERAGNSCLSPSPRQGNTLRAGSPRCHQPAPCTQLHPFISSVIDGAFRHPLSLEKQGQEGEAAERMNESLLSEWSEICHWHLLPGQGSEIQAHTIWS